MAKILIVDDNPSNRDLLVRLLEYRGYSLREASYGADALRDAIDLARDCGGECVVTKPVEPETLFRAVDQCLRYGIPMLKPAAQNFDHEHLRLITDKLSEQTSQLTSVNRRLEALIDINLQLSQTQHDRLPETFCISARGLISAKYALVGIASDDGRGLADLCVAGVDLEEYPVKKNLSAAQQAIAGLLAQGLPLRKRNPGGDPKALGFPSEYPNFESLLVAPIASLSQSYGWLCLFHRLGAIEFSEEDERLVGILGALVGRIYATGSLDALAQERNTEMGQKLNERRWPEAALEERDRLASLGTEIGIALTRAGTVGQGLQQSAEAFVRYMGVALTCIWTLNEKTNELELQASAGMDTDLDGPQGRVPVGKFKIGLIAQRRTPHLSNDVPNDPEVSNSEWAKRQGIVAFAGYPLAVEGRLAGVVAAFGRQPFSEAILQAFTSISIQLAHFIMRRRAEAETRDAVERLNLALKASRIGIWTWDAINDLIVWDEHTYEIFGLPPGSLGGTLKDFIALIHPEDRDAALRAVQQCNPKQPEYVATSRVIWPDGSVHYLDGGGRAFYDEAGQLLRMTGTSRDITEQRQLEEQFRQAQKMEAVGQLAGGIAHDFNNVLNVIIGYSQLLLASSALHDLAYHRVEEIRKAGARATALTQQLLAFSRKQVLQPQVLNLADILHDLDHLVGRTIGEDIEVLTTVDENLAQVKIDPSQMQQVLLNLVLNARHAMPQGGKLTLELVNVEVDESSARVYGIPAGRYVMFGVSDNGSGMTPEVQQRVFEPFFTTKGVGQGTGLGLATVYGIVKQSGGHIWLCSESGIGTTFKIFLPRVDEPRENTFPEPLQKMTGGDETILVVEDDPGLRALAQEVLSSVGYNIIAAEDGNEALRASEQYTGQIQLLLTDVVLPKMSGKEIASRLTELRPEMNVLFMSGYAGNVISKHGTLDQGVDLIQKPWTPEGLCEKIRAVLAVGSFIHRILVVDDERGIRSGLTEILEGAGYQVVSAQDSREARAKTKEHTVDLVITDLAMPEEEAMEMIRAIRKDHPLKIIAMSGALGPDILRVAKLLGARATLAKPLEAKMVLQCIRDLAQVRQSA